MTYIVLTREQSQIIAASVEAIEVRDTEGSVLAHIEPIHTAEDIAVAKARLASDQPRYRSEQVQSHFRALEEGLRDGLNHAEALKMLERLQAEARP